MMQPAAILGPITRTTEISGCRRISKSRFGIGIVRIPQHPTLGAETLGWVDLLPDFVSLPFVSIESYRE
jgi:hypothetical protein